MPIFPDMYITLMPVILAGIANMVFMKMPGFTILKRPIDNGIILPDKRRLLGDNKTWKGFLGLIFLCIFFMVIWGFIVGSSKILLGHDAFYSEHLNSPQFNLLTGLALGLAYALFELPNSFMKRRLGIAAGRTPKGIKGLLFLILDHTDSMFGCILVVALLLPMGLLNYLTWVAAAGATHLTITYGLFIMKIKDWV
jgi:CDP-diglyceride synthetase